MKNIPLKALILTCALAGLASVQSHANIIVSEKFDYTLGENIGGQSGGLGWNGGWQGGTGIRGTATLESVNFGPKAPQKYSQSVGSPALRLNTNATGTLDTYRQLGAAISLRPTAQTTYYFSYLWMRVDDPSAAGEASYFSLRTASGTQLVNFGVSGTEVLEIRAETGATGAGSVAVATGTESILVTNNINTTGQYLIVGKMVLNADGVGSQFYLSAYNNADVLAGEPESWDVSLTTNLVDIAIGRVVLTTAQYGGASYWDNITIGTSFEDVGGAIPESSTVALVMGAGVLGLVAVRRMRRRA